jgi:alkanesulfonate monooxygenase SsuD/methylene tetrahydromethanopterin reductase-like flavin-dependent oxidoreductase (luciferase family)
MKFGTILPLFNGEPHKTLASAADAERLGYDGVFVFDHFFPPGAPSHLPALEAFTMMAAVAEATERVRIGTLVTRASLRPPGILAKMVASIDAQSGGRLILGVGTGDPIDEPEHVAFGFKTLTKEERRAYLREAILALKALFEGRTWAGGEHVPALTGPLLPPPAQAGGPPVWIGAQAEPVLRIAAEVADGWNGWGIDAPRFAKKAAILRAACEETGRTVEPTWAGIVLVGEDHDEAERLLKDRLARGMEEPAWTGGSDELVELVAALRDEGATWVILVPAGPRDRKALIAEQVLPKFAEYAGADPTPEREASQ